MLNSSDLLSKPVEELKNIVKEKRKSGSDKDREQARVKREKLEAETANGGATPMDADDADVGADAIDDELEQMKKALGKGSAGKED